MKAHERLSVGTPILIGMSLFLIGAAQITALWTLTKVMFSTSFKSSAIEEVQPAKFSPQMYQLEIVDRRIQLIPKTVYTAATSIDVALTEALERLLTQSSTFNPTSAIPANTRLLNLHIENDGIHIDLSSEFAKGGGSSSMIYRVAQVIYTATSIDSQTPVFLTIKGKPLNDEYPLGGEGLTLEYPITRQQFDRDFLVK